MVRRPVAWSIILASIVAVSSPPPLESQDTELRPVARLTPRRGCPVGGLEVRRPTRDDPDA